MESGSRLTIDSYKQLISPDYLKLMSIWQKCTVNIKQLVQCNHCQRDTTVSTNDTHQIPTPEFRRPPRVSAHQQHYIPALLPHTQSMPSRLHFYSFSGYQQFSFYLLKCSFLISGITFQLVKTIILDICKMYCH